jgi:hypothetical protein
MATVAEDNVLHVFRPSATALGQDGEEIDEAELE